MGHEGAMVGNYADRPASLFDFLMQLRQLARRFEPRPEGMDQTFLVKAAGHADPRLESGVVDLAERRGDVLGAVAIDFADEFHRAVQLLVILPARARYAFHDAEEEATDRGGRADGDEQAMHGNHIIVVPRTRNSAKSPKDKADLTTAPVLLEIVMAYPDITDIGGTIRRKGEYTIMDNRTDPRTTGFGYAGGLAGGRSDVAFDAGLRSYMLSVYNYMASGVLLTGIVAMLFANSAAGQDILTNGGALRWVIMLAPLAFVMVLSFGINRLSTVAAQALFWAFATVMGLSMASIFLVYTGTSIAQTFFATAAAFLGLSLYGYTTKKDLSGWGTFLIMGVVGLLVAMLLNAFIFQSSTMTLAISAIGVLIFAALTAYDTQRIKSMYAYVAGTDMMGKTVIMGALSLYLDFVNMFTFLLSFMGGRE